MSRRPFDPEELDQATPIPEAIIELEHYARASQSEAPQGLAGRIMVAIEREPAPRRGFLAWLLTSASTGGGPGRFVRAGALVATLVLAVAGALFAGQLADFVRDVGGNPTPTPSISPSPTESPSLAPSSSVEASPSASPEASDDHGASPVVATALPTPKGTANATPEDSGEESKTATPSPTVTASPSATPR